MLLKFPAADPAAAAQSRRGLHLAEELFDFLAALLAELITDTFCAIFHPLAGSDLFAAVLADVFWFWWSGIDQRTVRLDASPFQVQEERSAVKTLVGFQCFMNHIMLHIIYVIT